MGELDGKASSIARVEQAGERRPKGGCESQEDYRELEEFDNGAQV